jgi:hypothetical protein
MPVETETAGTGGFEFAGVGKYGAVLLNAVTAHAGAEMSRSRESRSERDGPWSGRGLRPGAARSPHPVREQRGKGPRPADTRPSEQQQSGAYA